MTDQTKPLLPDLPDEIWAADTPDGWIWHPEDMPGVPGVTRYVRADRPVSGDMKVVRDAFFSVRATVKDHPELLKFIPLGLGTRISDAEFALERIEAAQSSGVPEWHPIETAPEETPVLTNQGTAVFTCDQPGDQKFWCLCESDGDRAGCAEDGAYYLYPTHWMPLPAAPKADTKTGDE